MLNKDRYLPGLWNCHSRHTFGAGRAPSWSCWFLMLSSVIQIGSSSERPTCPVEWSSACGFQANRWVFLQQQNARPSTFCLGKGFVSTAQVTWGNVLRDRKRAELLKVAEWGRKQLEGRPEWHTCRSWVDGGMQRTVPAGWTSEERFNTVRERRYHCNLKGAGAETWMETGGKDVAGENTFRVWRGNWAL